MTRTSLQTIYLVAK